MESWRRGRETIERLLEAGELEQVRPSGSTARRLLDAAEAHLELARRGVEIDLDGAFQLAYTAARKSCTALLTVQGLRATDSSSLAAVEDAMVDQFGGSTGMPAFNKVGWVGRLRNATEYPGPDTPPITAEDTTTALEAATEIHDACRSILDSGHLGTWE